MANDKVMEKIRKLLALAGSSNENEAKQALLKARKLMAENKLSQLDIQGATGTQEVIVLETGVSCTKMTNPWAAVLSGIISDYYCCRAMRSHRKGDKKVTIELVGLKDDVELCNKIYHYAYETALSLISRNIHRYHAESASHVRERRNAFGWGFARGVQYALEEQRRAAEDNKESWGLVMVTPQPVIEFISRYGAPTNYGTIKRDEELDKCRAQGMKEGQKFSTRDKLEV